MAFVLAMLLLGALILAPRLILEVVAFLIPIGIVLALILG